MVRKEFLLTAGFSVLAAAAVGAAVFLTEPKRISPAAVVKASASSALSAASNTDTSSAPAVSVAISLRPVTATEFAGIGTHGITNPIPTDFQTLTIEVKGENLRKRAIQVPTARELTDALTNQVVWFTNSGRQDNANENYANYHLKLVLFTRNISKQLLNSKLSAFFVGVSYEDAGGKQVNRTYVLSEAVPPAKPEAPVASCVKEYQKNRRSYLLEAEPRNEAEEMVAVDFLCPFNGDFERMAQVEGSDQYLAQNVQITKEAVEANRGVQSIVIHSMTSQPEGTAPPEENKWAEDTVRRDGLVSWRIVTAAYTEEWPVGFITQYGNGVF